ncbi:tyrosine-type recombinase/integrase [Actinomadura sp. NEAU-AAG7]|uniref:tyrosine-type recombinase/integrase n=1 Tax=Actinomadura sp. NEAU-AAG7 TaxID=2839640 RepID=UPI001BE4C9FA|nr:tyrosine-type recombinase/integrase [Actinomadura sp. NEAU-AAG7]MBT2212157.1 tyrosine-type recombinase/integrase [Actinomadura sp. NEAU-AAG7]
MSTLGDNREPLAMQTAVGTSAVIPPIEQPVDPDHGLSPAAAARVMAGLADNTSRAYTRHWATFTRWCELTGRTALPATRETLAEYMHHLTGTTTQYGRPPAPSTIDAMLSCVQSAHKLAGHDCDARLARMALRAYRRERASDPDPARRYRARRAPEIDLGGLRAMIDAIGSAAEAHRISPLRAERDQAVLVLGFAMMGRRSEVAALDIEDLTFTGRGLIVGVRRSKSDQDAIGREVILKPGRRPQTDPVALLRSWVATLDAHGITSGPLLRGIDRHDHLAGTSGYAGRGAGRISDETLNTIVRDAARRADLDDAARYTFHGLRAGAATAAAESGAAPSTIQEHGRWNSLAMVFRYWRRGSAWANNALDDVGL